MTDEPNLFAFQPSQDEPEKVRKARKPKSAPEARPKTDRMVVGEDLLSDADKQAIREEAEKHVSADFKKAARERYLKEQIAAVRQSYAPEEEMLSVLIDLPGHSKMIVINSREYHHGATYTVPLSQFRTMNEIMFRAWQHEDVVGGVNRDSYTKPARNLALRPGMENFSHPNSTIMRV